MSLEMTFDDGRRFLTQPQCKNKPNVNLYKTMVPWKLLRGDKSEKERSLQYTTSII